MSSEWLNIILHVLQCQAGGGDGVFVEEPVFHIINLGLEGFRVELSPLPLNLGNEHLLSLHTNSHYVKFVGLSTILPPRANVPIAL